jgi:hypothetical protein
MPKGPIEAIIKLLSEELRDLISGLPEHLRNSGPKQLNGNRPASERSTDPKGSTPPATPQKTTPKGATNK